MKKAFLFILSMGFFIASFAQPVIHAYDVNPVVGDTIVLNSYNNTINTGSNGANQTWDFSFLTAQYPRITSHYISPAGTFNAASFSNANLCVVDSAQELCYYYYADSTRFTYIGLASPYDSNIYERYFNPQATYRYPITYNTHYSDSVSEIYIHQIVGTSPVQTDTIAITGKADWNVVGYGTLVLPSGTFNNVLKVVITDTDSVYYYRNHTSAIYPFTETCWFYPGIHTPILDHYNHTTTYLAGTPTAINEMVAKKYHVTCFPNPAQNIVNLSFELKQPGDVAIQVMAANGAVVLKQENRYSQSGAATMSLNINQLSAGIYFADLSISGVHVNQQFIKN